MAIALDDLTNYRLSTFVTTLNFCHYFSLYFNVCNFLSEIPGNNLVFSLDLANEGHYDLDRSRSYGIFVEKIPGQAKHWYFVLPNCSLNGNMSRDGVVIKLSHGSTIVWDGRVLGHCSSEPVTGPNNSVFGMMVGSTKK